MRAEVVLHMHNCLMISIRWSAIIKIAFNHKYKQEFIEEELFYGNTLLSV